MRNHLVISLSLIAGTICAFALGVVSAPRLGVIFGFEFFRQPVVTVSLDLMEQVTSLQGQKNRVNAALAESAERVLALEGEIVGIRQGSGSALAEREAELVDARRRVAALTKREAELQGARQRNAALSAKVEGLQRARDRARKAIAALTKQKSDLQATLQNNAMMAAKLEGPQRARDEAGEASAARLQTIDMLRRDLASITGKHESRRQALNAEISRLSEALEGKDREIVRLQQTIEETRIRATPAISLPAAPPPIPTLPAVPSLEDSGYVNGSEPTAGTGMAQAAAAYHAADYVKAYGIWRPLAERGNARAQFHLGALYYEGRGVAKNLDSARLWLERAAGNGSNLARSLLSRMGEERPAKGRTANKDPAADR